MTLTYRVPKGIPLTYQEGDDNLLFLDKKLTLEATNPTATDDSTGGFTVGQSLWFNVSTGKFYEITDSTLDTAIWSEISLDPYSNAVIKSKYEANTNTNAFTDALLTKLSTVEERSNHTGTQVLSTITPNNIVGSISHLDDMVKVLNHTLSAGVMNGCDLTDNLDGTVSFTAGEGLLRASNDPHTTLYAIEIPAQIELTMLSGVNYVSIDWNAGNPTFITSADITSFNCLDTCIAYVIVRDGTTLSWMDAREQNVDSNRKTRRLFLQFNRFIHLGSGSTLGDAGALSVDVTSGLFNFMLEELSHEAFDTSVAGTAGVNVFDLYYRDGVGGYTQVVEQKVVDTTLYDDGTGTLATIANSKFGVMWFYVVLNNPNHLVGVVGQFTYASQGDAESATPPSSIPPILEGLGVLVGLTTFQESDTEFISVLSAFTETLSASGATSHNALSGIQGGSADDYQHLTTAELTKLGIAVPSDTTEANTSQITNMVSISQANYDLLTPVASTLYVIVG